MYKIEICDDEEYQKSNEKQNFHYISKLLGGQKQRTAITRAIVNDPDIFFPDEPTGALDTKTSQEIMVVFRELNAKGKTVIIITHDMEIAKKVSEL